jgi:hypothetical protein
VASDGILYGTLTSGPDGGAEHDTGTWHITADGRFCNSWNVCNGWREGCFAVYREGETFELSRNDRFVKKVFRRMPGNPEGY